MPLHAQAMQSEVHDPHDSLAKIDGGNRRRARDVLGKYLPVIDLGVIAPR